MGQIEDRITAMGLALLPPVVVPPDVQLPFAFVNICGNRAIVSGHGPQGPDGTVTGSAVEFFLYKFEYREYILEIYHYLQN